MRVALLALDDMGEALLLRAMLEHLGAEVHLRPVGRPSELFTSFSAFGGAADVALIAAHGDDKGFVFPEMAPGADDLVLPGNRIGPDLLKARLAGLPPVVVSTACDTGRSAIAGAFLAGGARTYVAPAFYPDGASVPVLLSLVFYRVLHAGAAWQAALKAANNFFTLENRFEIFGDPR